ncbi:MAG: hypothetical protein D6761_09155 [Candidatus Dadabacteria bacterium]|nr:MAG: hypothetical protein D6761_09155 [Candidatus Dadabacteria bacterium]
MQKLRGRTRTGWSERAGRVEAQLQLVDRFSFVFADGTKLEDTTSDGRNLVATSKDRLAQVGNLLRIEPLLQRTDVVGPGSRQRAVWFAFQPSGQNLTRRAAIFDTLFVRSTDHGFALAGVDFAIGPGHHHQRQQRQRDDRFCCHTRPNQRVEILVVVQSGQFPDLGLDRFGFLFLAQLFDELLLLLVKKLLLERPAALIENRLVGHDPDSVCCMCP